MRAGMPLGELEKVFHKLRSHKRLLVPEAAILYQKASDADLQYFATKARQEKFPGIVATYAPMAIINYTNICVAKCDYCAFFRPSHAPDSYLLTFSEISKRIDGFLELVGRGVVGMNGGFHPKLKIHYYAELFRKIIKKYKNNIIFYAMTVAEFLFVCRLSKISYQEGAKILKQAGIEWITGGGAEILTNSFRERHSPGKFSIEEYYNAQRELLNTGLKSTATMVIGFDESLAERLSHLEKLRKFQDSVQGRLRSFLCWVYKPSNTKLGGEETSHRDYLRWLAVCRLFLDNISHIRTSILTKNETAILALKYGANDFDLPTEDEVTEKAGAKISHNFDCLLKLVNTYGFQPVRRHELNFP